MLAEFFFNSFNYKGSDKFHSFLILNTFIAIVKPSFHFLDPNPKQLLLAK